MKYIIALAVISVLMFLLKFPEGAGLHFTDANNYIYLAQQIEHGKLVYRDIELDNFPLMLYISVIYKFFTFGDMQWFNATVTLEKIAIAALLYFFTYRHWKKHSTAFLVAITFFLSYSVVANSFQLGFFTSILCILIAYYFTTRDKLILAGIFAACAVLIKAYALFPILGLLIHVLYNHKEKSMRFIVAGTAFGIVVMIPTILFAFPQFLKQTFGFGLVRAAAESKLDMYVLFAQNNALVFILCIYNLFLWKRNIFLAAGTALLTVFFIFYRDIYFIYFSFYPLLAAIGAGYLIETTIPHTKFRFPIEIFATLLVVATCISINGYFANDRFADNIPNPERIYQSVIDQHPDSIYGLSYLINGICYVTGIPPYKNMYDITTTGFNNARINRKQFTDEVLKTRSVVVVDSIVINGKQRMYDESVMDIMTIVKKCKNVSIHPVRKIDNAQREIMIFRCF